MAKKIMTSMWIDPEIKYFAKQVADAQNRTLGNLIEFLLSQEIKQMRESGYKFIKYNDASTEFVGSGTDEKLADEFEKFTRKK